MGTFLAIVLVLAAIVVLLRHIRKKEIIAFMEADLSLLEEFRSTEAVPGPAIRAIASPVPGAGALADPDLYEAKEAILDDVYRSFLLTLEQVVENRYRIFVHVPLQDIARSQDTAAAARLKNRSVSFVLCETGGLSVVCAIALKGTSRSEAEQFAFVTEVFRQLRIPLYSLPVLTSYSSLELRELLERHLSGSLMQRSCPKCGKPMSQRKALKGVNAGKTFWVCKEFPGCKGLVRI